MSGDYRQGASPYSLWRHSDGQGDTRRQTSGKPDKSGTFKYNPPRLKQGYITPNTNLRDPGPQGRADGPEEATGQPYEARGQPDVENDQPEVTRVHLGEPRSKPNKVRGKTTSHNSSLLDYNFGDDVTTPIAPFIAPLVDKNQDIQKQNQQKQETNPHQRSTPDSRLLKRIDGVKKQINSADNNIYVENADEGCQLIKSESEQQPRYPLNSKRELEQESHRYNQEQHEQQQQKQRNAQHQQQLEKQYKQQQLEKQHQQQLEKQIILKLEKQKQLELEKQKHAKIQEHRRNQIQNEQQQQQHLTLHHHQQQHQQQYQQQLYQQQQYQQYQQHYQKQCQQQYQQQQQKQQKHQQQHGLHNNGFGRTYVPNLNPQVVPSKVVAGSQLVDQVCPDSEWFLRNTKEHPGTIQANGGHKEGTQSNDSWSLGDEKCLKETSPKTHHSDGKYTKVFSNKLSNKVFLPMDDEPTIPGKLAQGVINNNNQCSDQDFVVHHTGERQSCKHKIKDPVPSQRCETKERAHSVVLERCERNEHGPFGIHGKQSDDSLCRDYKQVISPKTQTQNCMKRERSDRFRSSFNPNEVMEDTKSIVRNVNLNRATRDKSVEDFNYSIYDNQHNQVYHKSSSFQRSARKVGDVSYNTQEEGQRQYDYSWFLHLQDLQKQRLKESLGITTAADPLISCGEPLANTNDSPLQKTAKSNYGENNILQSTHDQIEDSRCQRKEFKSEGSTFDEQEKLAKDEENILVVKSSEKCNREEEKDRGYITLESSPKKQHTKSLVISPETKCDSNVSPRPLGKLVKLFQDIKLFTPKDASPTRYTSPECGLITNPLIPTPSPPEDAPRHNIDQPEPPSRSDIESLRSVTQFLLSQQSPQRFLFTSPSCARQTQTVEQAQSSPSIERQTQTHPIAVVKRDYDATPVRVPSAIPGVDALVPPMRTRVNRSAHGRSSSRPERAQSPRPSLARTASQSSPPSKSRSKATVHIRRLSPSDSNTGVAHRKAARKSTKKSTTTLV